MFTLYGGDWKSGVERSGCAGCALTRATIAATSAEVSNILSAAAGAAGAAAGCWANAALAVSTSARAVVRIFMPRILCLRSSGHADHDLPEAHLHHLPPGPCGPARGRR